MLTGYVVWFTTLVCSSQRFFMRKEAKTSADSPVKMYLIGRLALIVLAGVLIAGYILIKSRLGGDWTALNYACVAAAAMIATALSLWIGLNRGRALPAIAGLAGLGLSLGVCVWALSKSNFQLTENSYASLRQANVPADLIADLKGAQGAAAESEQQFLAELDQRFGHDHIAPYQEALVRSGWNLARGAVFAGLTGFGASLGLCAGAFAVTPGARRRSGCKPIIDYHDSSTSPTL